jgi:hypothetical protein
VWGSNLKRAGVGPIELTENGEIRLRINDFVLLDGTYDLTVAISDLSETHEYDHWDRRIRFDVRQGRIRDEGLVYIKGLWEV